MVKNAVIAAALCLGVSGFVAAQSTAEVTPVELQRQISSLEQRLDQLQTRESIKDLRHTYWFSLIDKDVDRLADCFTEDAELDYGFNTHLKGKPAIRAFFQRLLGSPDLHLQIPRGSNPLLTITGADTASGRWLIDVVVMSKGEAPNRRMAVQYMEQYRRQSDGWKISRMKNDYFFFEKPVLTTEMK